MHQTVGNVLRTVLYSERPKDLTKAKDIVDNALATAMHSMRTNVTTTLKSSPGALVYAQNMFLNILLIADWQTIQKHREQLVKENLRRASAKRRTWDYQPKDMVLRKTFKPTKLGEQTTGPYRVSKVHCNGTVTLVMNDDVTERINIRRILPFRTDN